MRVLAGSLTVLSIVLASTLAAPALGQDHIHRVSVEVGEQGCPGDRSFCFEVVEGDLSKLAPRSTVELTFQNTGSISHELLVTRLANATDHVATERDSAFATGERDLAPGETTTFQLEIPASWEGLYLWCGVAGHEESGMWLEAAFEQDAGSNGVPGLGLLVSLVAGAGAATVKNRPSRARD